MIHFGRSASLHVSDRVAVVQAGCRFGSKIGRLRSRFFRFSEEVRGDVGKSSYFCIAFEDGGARLETPTPRA